MYYIGDKSAAVERDDKKRIARRKFGWPMEDTAPLRSSRVFKSEGDGFFHVRDAREKADKPISEDDCAPIAIF